MKEQTLQEILNQMIGYCLDQVNQSYGKISAKYYRKLTTAANDGSHSAEDVLNHLLTDLEDQGYSSL